VAVQHAGIVQRAQVSSDLQAHIHCTHVRMLVWHSM
jgi:hypothetical protein